VVTSSVFDRVSRCPIRAKLIFNVNSGRAGESPQQLVDILSATQAHNILTDVHMLHPESPVEAVVRDALKAGIRLIIVAGGDGTIDGVAGPMVGTDATLGIIPTGTRNNLALNLGIPNGIPEAVALLRNGHRRKVDVGFIQRGRVRRWFLEAATVGLLSDIYPVADNIQHGNLAQIGELLSTFFAANPARLRLELDGHKKIDTTSHMVLVANMSFIGPHFRISPKVSFRDRRLDVFVFDGMSKLNLVSYVMQALAGPVERDKIKHYRVRKLKIHAAPGMPVLADGNLLGQGDTTVAVRPHALTIMTGAPYSGQTPEEGQPPPGP
jgi:diacylglycerol kinase (ATP)